MARPAAGRCDFRRRNRGVDGGARLQPDRSRRDRGAVKFRPTLTAGAEGATLPHPAGRGGLLPKAAGHLSASHVPPSSPTLAGGGNSCRHGRGAAKEAGARESVTGPKAAAPRCDGGARRIADGDPTSVATTPTRLAAPRGPDGTLRQQETPRPEGRPLLPPGP